MDKKQLADQLLEKRDDLKKQVDKVQFELDGKYSDHEIIRELINDVKGLDCRAFDYHETFGGKCWYTEIIKTLDYSTYDFSTILPQIKKVGYYLTGFLVEDKLIRVWFQKIGEDHNG